MSNKITLRRTVLLISIMLLALYTTQIILGCGPFSKTAIFTYSAHPDFPLENFARGDLGVLKPEYARSYLVVAYRYLTDEKLSAKEQKSIVELWNNRLNTNPSSDNSTKPSSEPVEDAPDVGRGLSYWSELRKTVVQNKEDLSIDATKNINGEGYYINYINCKENAFSVAADTLSEKIKTLGANNPEVQDWVTAQDQVFANCSSAQPIIPGPVKPNASPRAKADRAYQIAAAMFYSGQFDQSASLFKTIANDKTSPWHKVAPYLAARSLVRKAMLTPPSDKNITFEGYFDRKIMQQAQTEIKALLNNQELKEYHPASRRLLRYVEFRLDPTSQLNKLAQLIVKPGSRTIGADLDDYTSLLDHLADDPFDYDLPKAKITKKLPELLGKQELTDWVLNFQLGDPSAVDYAVQKWQKQHSPLWLVSAITKIEATHKEVPELLKAADQINPTSPAFASVAFHKVRLLMDLGKKGEASEQLDKILTNNLTPSARNEFLSQRMMLAQNLDEFLKYAQRTVVAEGYFFDNRELPDDMFNPDGDVAKKKSKALKQLFDDDSTEIMNKKFPLEMMKDAALSQNLPANLHKRLVMATWVRAVLLDNEETGKTAAMELIKLLPATKDNLTEYLNATTPDARKFAAVFTMLKFPATRPIVNSNVDRETPIEKIDDFRDNWWCSFDEKASDAQEDGKSKPKTKQELPIFLNKKVLSRADTEQKQLIALGTAPNFLCNEVIKWAKANLTDPRVPEALHLAVKSTRFGCTDDKTSQFSKSAFQVLHKNFPSNPWTKKTPYYF